MKLKKKVFIGMATMLFAVATVFNMSMLNENGAGDVSLDAIQLMAKAEAESGGSHICRFVPFHPSGCIRVNNWNYSYCPSWAC